MEQPQPLVSEKAVKLILESEGLDQPYLFPGGSSGITIGIGDDLGYQNLEEFSAKWKSKLPTEYFESLKSALGITGLRAAAIAKNFRGIHIKREDAEDVFMHFTLPQYYKLTVQTFPGLLKLCKDAQGAIISLVYNRGSSLTGDRRAEMYHIKLILDHTDIASNKTYEGIAKEFLSMRRLWIGKGLDGLIIRREAEAALVKSCIS